MDGVEASERPEAVYFYGTCLVDLFFPEAGLSGIGSSSARGSGSSSRGGRPAAPSRRSTAATTTRPGRWRGRRSPLPRAVTRRRPVGLLRRDDGSHYPALFEGDPAEEAARAFAARVFELTQFLCRRAEGETGRPRARRCVSRGIPPATRCARPGIVEEPRSLLAQLANVELVAAVAGAGVLRLRGDLRGPRARRSRRRWSRTRPATSRPTGAPDPASRGTAGCLLNIGGPAEAAAGETVRVRPRGGVPLGADT